MVGCSWIYWRQNQLENCTHFSYPTDDRLLIYHLFQRHHSGLYSFNFNVFIVTVYVYYSSWFCVARAAIRVSERDVKQIPAVLKDISENQLSDLRRQVKYLILTKFYVYSVYTV